MQYCALKGKVSEVVKWNEEEFIRSVVAGFYKLTQEPMNQEQKTSWRGAWRHLKQLFSLLPQDLSFVLEYRLPMSNERIDLVFLGYSQRGCPVAVVLELKGWHKVVVESEGVVMVDGERHQHPEWQTLNYLGKLKFGHSAARDFCFVGAVWLYNLSADNLKSLSFKSLPAFGADGTKQLANFLKSHLAHSLPPDMEDRFVNGYYSQTTKFFEAIKRNFENLREGSLRALCGTGFGPSEEQSLLIDEILEAVSNDERKICFLIQGEPGSGKTYVAVLTLLEALKRSANQQSNVAVLGYRNSRLLNTIRRVFDECERGLSSVIWFYAPPSGKGLAKGDPNDPKFERFQLVLCDEAQRLTRENIRVILHRAERVVAFFYDENQILSEEEEGWSQNFKKIAEGLGFEVREKKLSGIYRVQGGKAYHDFVEKLLTDPLNANLPSGIPYEFKVFDNMQDMLNALRQKAEEGNKVALVAAFTESPGDRKKPTGQTSKNLRIGYPLESGFDRYKDSMLNIYWLMDERQQYPNFWYGCESNKLTHCASIYGCQGFEADYVGVVWGRDFVWRNNKWEIGDNCEDTVKYEKRSLKELVESAKKGNSNDKQLALRLLINRYRIFLTRGIKGTFVYCEDDETLNLLRSVSKPEEVSLPF